MSTVSPQPDESPNNLRGLKTESDTASEGSSDAAAAAQVATPEVDVLRTPVEGWTPERSIANDVIVQTSDPDLEPARPLTFVTTNTWLRAWIFFHGTYLVGGGAVGVYLFAHRLDGPVLGSLLAAAAMALSGAGAYYLRRIYRAGIRGKIEIVGSTEAAARRPRVLGTSLYLLSRPLIAAVLAVFLAMTVCVTWYGIATPGSEPGPGLVQLAAVYGFLVGYFSGRSISQLESSGKITV